MRHGGHILIDQLAQLGIARVFQVPGESFLAALDALHSEPRLQTIICRHEASATMMAEATARLTGLPGAAMVTRGPGAANAIAGLLIALEDETPMLLIVGLPGRALDGREAFQHFDVEKLFAGAAKATIFVRDTQSIPEATVHAFVSAMSGRPGPVVLAIPEDVLSQMSNAQTMRAPDIPRAAPSAAQMQALGEILNGAERPLMLLGGPGWSSETAQHVAQFAERFDLPVATAFRKQDYIDNRHPCYVGHTGFPFDSKLAAGIRAADVLLAVGARLGDFTTQGFTLVEAPEPRQHLIRVHPSPEANNALPLARTTIVSDLGAFAGALAGIEPLSSPPWRAFRRDLRAGYEKSLVPVPTPGEVRLEDVVSTLSSQLPETAIITNGAGNYSQFVHRYFQFKQHRTSLAPAYGTMGYGLPAAIAAKLECPRARVVAFAGDGCFQMSASELATAAQYALQLTVIVADNGMFGTIRMHQERAYPGRVSGTTLVNPDFAAFAHSCGAHGETVADAVEFAAAFERAMAAPGPSLIHLKLDPEAITPAETLSLLAPNSPPQV